IANVELRYRMDFPNGGAPARGSRAWEATVIFDVQMGVIDHELPDNFDLTALQGIYARKGPLGITGMRGHLGNDAGFVHGLRLALNGLRLFLKNCFCQVGGKTEADMKVVAVRKLKFAIGGFPGGGMPARAFAGIFNKIKISENGDDVAFAKIGKSRGRLGVIGGS